MRWLSSIAGVLLGAALGSLSADAVACGGTFCDGGPTGMPVDQKGENILFVVDRGNVEAHIQIQYEGDPARFAWVLPLPAVPDVIEVGSQPLFANLLAATVPMYGIGVCSFPINGGGGGAIVPTTPGSIEILLRETVGAFDVTVLSSQSSAEVVRWLSDNGYQNIPTAPALFDAYVAEGFVFAAVKLTGGAGLDEIHPLTVRYRDTGAGACVPLKLTAVAALADMGVRAFFLGEGRVVPSNYFHVVPNPARFDWVNFADNYQEVVARAVDEAGGHAFVTEYAGPSNIVSTAGLYSATWNPQRFVALPARDVIFELEAQGLATCGGGTCQFAHPLLLPLLREHLPPPPLVDEDAFYSCLACYPAEVDALTWDGVAFARDLLERIVSPGLNATRLLARYPYLTRLLTAISPEEMTVDPLFIERADLEPVSQVQTVSSGCSGGTLVTLPGDFQVALDGNNAWPGFGDEMPWALSVMQYSETIDVPVADNSGLIADVLDEWNATLGESPMSEPMPSFPAGPDDFSGPTPPPGSDPVMPGTNVPPASDGSDSGGCGCRMDAGRTVSSPAALLVAGLLLCRMRRRSRWPRA